MAHHLADYPTSWGSSRVSIFVHHGPAAYAPITGNGVPGNGDVVMAAEAGLKAFDAVIPLGVSYNPGGSAHTVRVAYPNGNTPGPGTAAVPARTVLLRWMTALEAEVAENTDLSTQSVRLLAIGPK